MKLERLARKRTMTTRARIHTLILWFILVDYGVYSVAVALEKMSGFFGIGGLFALLVQDFPCWGPPSFLG